MQSFDQTQIMKESTPFGSLTKRLVGTQATTHCTVIEKEEG
jgi:hypothetical protein